MLIAILVLALGMSVSVACTPARTITSPDPKTTPVLPSALHAPSGDLNETNSYFAVVGSFKTAKKAMQHLQDIRQADLSANVAVYPPYESQSDWTVVAASYTSKEEAERYASYARQALNIRDAFVKKIFKKQSPSSGIYNVFIPSVALSVYPNLIAPPAAAASSERSTFVFVEEGRSEEDTNNRADELRQNFPGLNIAVFPPLTNGEPWRIALAAHATAEQARTARELARHLGLAEKPIEKSFKASEVFAWHSLDRTLAAAAFKFRKRVESCFRDGSVTMGEMRSCAGSWVTPQALLTCIGDSNSSAIGSRSMVSEACAAIPDTPEGAILIVNQGLSASTTLTLQISNFYQVKDADLTSCVVGSAGDARKMQQCMLPKLFTKDQKAAVDCMQKSSTGEIQACLRKAAVALSGPQRPQAEATLKCMASEDGTLVGITKCLPIGDRQALERLQRFQQCSGETRSEKDFASKCVPELRGDLIKKCLVHAAGNAEKIKDCTIREVPSGNALLRAAKCANSKDPIKLSECLSLEAGAGTLPAAIAACLTTAGSSTVHISDCLRKTDGRFEAAQKLHKCVEASKTDPIALVRTCGDMMGTDSQNLAVCLLAKGGDPKTALSSCGVLPADAIEVADTIECIQKDGLDSNHLAECMVQNRPNYRAAVQTAQCFANTKGDETKLTTCAIAQVGGTAGAVTQCMLSQPPGSRDPLKCVGAADPRLAEAQKAYTCIQKAGDVTSALEACTDGVVDRKTQEALTCVSRANGDRAALAACAGQALLPGEAGRLAGCAASSQGAASFGVCAISPSINEEWRIAADCAIASGGEPISFATCTGGRLTIRELTKCLGGKIGEDCFGPNNTIRKYYENMFNDLTKGPGPNNEAVKAIKAVGEGIKAVDEGVKHVEQEIRKELARREEEARKTLEKPLDNPARTAGCIASALVFCNL